MRRILYNVIFSLHWQYSFIAKITRDPHTANIIKMKTTFCFCFFALVALALARPQFQQQNGPAEPYDFSYKVENPPTNTFFGQNENGDSSGSKTGSYYVLLPDGRTMTVDYVANANGFAPRVSFGAGGGGSRFQG